MDKKTGQVLGWALGGGVGVLKSFKRLGKLKNLNVREKILIEFMSPAPTRSWTDLEKEVSDSSKEGWNLAMTTKIGHGLDTIEQKSNPLNWVRRKKKT